jgi:hypothetical protein
MFVFLNKFNELKKGKTEVLKSSSTLLVILFLNEEADTRKPWVSFPSPYDEWLEYF